jgi:hypothetical protein
MVRAAGAADSQRALLTRLAGAVDRCHQGYDRGVDKIVLNWEYLLVTARKR